MNNVEMYTRKDIQQMKNNDEKMKAYIHNMDKMNELEEKQKIEEAAGEIRNNLLNEEGKENRNKMRRKYQDIIMMDDEELIKWHETA